MGTTSGYITRNQDLIINMDAANSRSYSSGSTKCECLVSTVEGVLENGTSFSPEYKGGWIFDGTNDYLNLGDRVNINPELDSFTCNIFFKIDPSSNDSNIIASKGNGSSGLIGWLIYYSNLNGVLTVRCNGDNTISERAAQYIPINKGQNYMVTMVINRTDNTIKGYLNGSNVGWVDGNYIGVFTGNSISGFGSITNSDDFLIGERPQLNLPMIGTIYLFQTYNFALSEAQVYRNFRFFGGRYDLSVPPPSFNNNYSFEFDGTNDAVQVGAASTSLGISGAITISFWCKMPSGSTAIGPAPLGEDSTGSTTRNWGFICVFNSLIFQIWNADGTVKNCTSPSNSQIQDNNWHHIVGTYDGTSNSGGIELFIDGSSVATATASSTGLRTSAQSMYIGAVGSSGNAFNWDGNIDEVSIWDSVKTISDVSDGGLPIDLSGKSNLVGWWRMGDNATFSTNWTIPDQVGSNDGVSQNMVLSGRTTDVPT